MVPILKGSLKSRLTERLLFEFAISKQHNFGHPQNFSKRRDWIYHCSKRSIQLISVSVDEEKRKDEAAQSRSSLWVTSYEKKKKGQRALGWNPLSLKIFFWKRRDPLSFNLSALVFPGRLQITSIIPRFLGSRPSQREQPIFRHSPK